MFKKLLVWFLRIFIFVWVTFVLIFFFAAACAIFVEGRVYLHALIEIIADIILWFWDLHWSILVPVLIVLSSYTIYLIKHHQKKTKKENS